MPETSAARLAANRLNATKSTGPKTVEGKERSSRNAMKHGFSASLITVHGDDPEMLAERAADWQEELNPEGRGIDGYLVGRLVRTSARLDRLDSVHASRVAKFARDARKARTELRMREVDLYAEMLLEGRCDVAVRRLMLIPEGCRYLIGEWESLRPALEPPAHWDRADQKRMVRLMGHYTAALGKCPGPLMLATLAIIEHRDVAHKLKRNENPDILMWVEKYINEQAHQYDLDKVGWLSDKSEKYETWLTQKIDTTVADLRDLKARLDAEDAAEDAELPYQAMFDATDEGKLIHRYEMDTERSFHRSLKELRDLAKARQQNTQPVVSKVVAQIRPPAQAVATAPPTSRNEPTGRGPDDPFSTSFEPRNPQFGTEHIAMVPRNLTKNQR
jgi:hypothetical protein